MYIHMLRPALFLFLLSCSGVENALAPEYRSRWEVVEGEWRFKGPALQGYALAGEVSSIKLELPVSKPRELQVEVLLKAIEGEQGGAHITFAGINFFHYATGYSGIYPPYHTVNDAALRLGKETRLRLVRGDDAYELYVDDRLIVRGSNEPVGPENELILYAVRGAEIEYRNLSVR